MNKKLYIKTYGCQMNEYDSARIADLMQEACGTILTQEPKEADIILLNTCSIREKAQEKVFSDLGRFRKLKEKNPNLMIAVGGCVATQSSEAILKRARYVDFIFGPQTLHRIPQLYQHVMKTGKSIIDVSFPEIEKFDALPEPKVEGPSAFVTIMEGCSRFCTYCVVPYTRGKEISRPVADVLAECQALAAQGVREITLLGQNVNAYRGKTDQNEKLDLAQLLQQVAHIPGIDRLRFTTSHPNAFSTPLIEAYAQLPQLANHLHLPVQSGSNRILKLMNRRYTVEEFKTKVAQLRNARPHISISSDFIVGFPGETETDFEETLQLVNEIQFDHSFSFVFSPRPGTPADKMADDVPLAQKKKRLATLQAALNESAMKISQHMVETTQTILVTDISKKSKQELSGRTENNRIVNFKGESDLIGQFVDVNITEALPNCLRGKLTKP